MRKKQKFTFEEHIKFADELCQMRAVAMRSVARLHNCYPFASRQVKRVKKLLNAIDSLRCEMDNVFYREYPGEQYRSPHYEWVHTPYYNPETVRKYEME